MGSRLGGRAAPGARLPWPRRPRGLERDWASPTERLVRLEAELRLRQASILSGGSFDPGISRCGVGVLGPPGMRMAVEEHGRGRSSFASVSGRASRRGRLRVGRARRPLRCPRGLTGEPGGSRDLRCPGDRLLGSTPARMRGCSRTPPPGGGREAHVPVPASCRARGASAARRPQRA